MDFSKLSDDELIALKNKDYSKLSNESLMALKQGAAQSQPSMLQRIKSQVTDPRNISAVARPILQGAGGLLGGAAGLPAAPATFGLAPLASGAAGFAAGDQLANRLDERLGLKQAPQNIGQVASEAGQSLLTGAKSEALGLTVAPVIKLIGKAAKPISSVLTGIPKNEYDVLAADNGAILPSRMKSASAALDEAKTAGGIKPDPIADIERALRDDKPFVKALKDKMANGQVLTPREAFEGNQAINTLIKNETDKDAKRGLLMLKKSFQDNLASLPGGVLSALKEYGAAKAGSKFRSPLPLTQGGKPAVVRTLAALTGLATSAAGGGIPFSIGALASSPAIAGAATIAGSQAYRTAANPLIRQGAISPFIAALLANKKKKDSE